MGVMEVVCCFMRRERGKRENVCFVWRERKKRENVCFGDDRRAGILGFM